MNDIKFLKGAIKFMQEGKKAKSKVWYSDGGLINHPKGTITIYAKEYGRGNIPKELNAKNETDLMTDYFDKDTARITPDNKYYKDVLKALNTQESFRKKIKEKRYKKYGWTL